MEAEEWALRCMNGVFRAFMADPKAVQGSFRVADSRKRTLRKASFQSPAEGLCLEAVALA